MDLEGSTDFWLASHVLYQATTTVIMGMKGRGRGFLPYSRLVGGGEVSIVIFEIE